MTSNRVGGGEGSPSGEEGTGSVRMPGPWAPALHGIAGTRAVRAAGTEAHLPAPPRRARKRAPWTVRSGELGPLGRRKEVERSGVEGRNRARQVLETPGGGSREPPAPRKQPLDAS